MTPAFTLVQVKEADYTLIQNLIRFYVYDLAEHAGWACPPNGLYGGCDDQPHYFGRLPDDPNDRWPEGWTGTGFKILLGQEIAGFCLVRFYAKEDTRLNDIGEFFILRKFRRQGLGQAVAHTVFDRYPGHWQIRQLIENRPAQAFWRHTIATYTKKGYSESRSLIPEYNIEMQIQRFTSPPQ